MNSYDSRSTDPPEDRYHITLLAVFLLGLTTLLPWNCFVTAESYWMYKLRTLNDSSASFDEPSSDLGQIRLNENQKFFMSYLSLVCNAIFLLTILANAFVRRTVSSEGRVTWSLVLTIICMGLVTAPVQIDTDSWQQTFMIAMLFIAGCTAFAVAILTGSSTGLCGFLPPRMMASTSIGQSVGGIVCTLVQIGCLLLGMGVRDTAMIFFLLSVSVLLLTFAFWKAMEYSDFYRNFRNRAGTPSEILQLSAPTIKSPSAYFTVFKEGWHFQLATFLIGTITIPLFPGLSCLAVSTRASDNSMLSGSLFLPLACFLSYNTADFVGRYTETYRPFNPKKRHLLLWLSILRVALIPLLMMCNIVPNNRKEFPVVFDNDGIFVAIMILAGLSNGYLLNAALVNAPKTTSLENQELSGNLAACSLSIGATIGSVLSYGLLKMFEEQLVT